MTVLAKLKVPHPEFNHKILVFADDNDITCKLFLDMYPATGIGIKGLRNGQFNITIRFQHQ